MAGADAAGTKDARSAARAVINAVTALLLDHHLPPTPQNYAFAYDVVCNPQGARAKAVARLIDGGVRLAATDVKELGGGTDTDAGSSPSDAAMLAATSADQMEDFATLVEAMRGDAEDFGNDLAAGTDAMRRSRDAGGVDRMIDVAGAMVKRVRRAERRLEAATMETRELRAKLQQARDNARRDPLTGLPNRRALEENYAAAAAAGEALCLAVCDVDSFKAFNDSYGHLIGDRVLKAIAGTLVDHCTAHLVARYGGEEFAVLFSGLALDGAMAMLDEARHAIAAKRYRLREDNTPLGEITFSAGLTAAAPAEPFASLFARADSLLYAAKADGRNCLKAG
jgi:diguanylate cyclase